MSDPVRRTSEWVYEGVWGVLAHALRVPRTPPELPVQPGEQVLALHPSEGYLRYLKFQFWIALVVFDGLVFAGWVASVVAAPSLGILISPIAIIVAVLPDIIAYVGIHVLYDTTWYVITKRSLRIRTGIWVLNELTITFENVQNVTVNQGPLQRFFGIADVTVETAGGSVATGPHGTANSSLHAGIIKGIDNAETVRSLIRERLGQVRTAGLGDEPDTRAATRATPWQAQHVEALREIRDTIRSIAH
ncbi:MAG: PH domain-containing protein [Candidatus Hydrogenedentes bacterium]|nr:PH domain-containing protein [Candidatus Hydrogenedentota bacterium]